MIRISAFLTIILAFCVTAAGAHAAAAWVGAWNLGYGGAAVGSASVALTATNATGGGANTPTAADALAVTVWAVMSASNYATFSVVDNESSPQTYTPIDNEGTATNCSTLAGYSCVSTFYICKLPAAPSSLTVTFSETVTSYTVDVEEFSGIAASSCLDGHNVNTQSSASGTNGVTSNNLLPSGTTANGDAIYGITFILTTSVTIASGTSSNVTFTAIDYAPGGFLSEYGIQTASSASTAATWTPGGASDFQSIGIALSTTPIASSKIGASFFHANPINFKGRPLILPQQIGHNGGPKLDN